ncbi:RHS repeat-associated core domain-containing protein [Pseudomonas sp. GM78]|uniref:RHS repeat-associated core domain-containing protein n=1 Tax=Pseudomonas sp. GM78 TaxID=1144337 RepID=UPI0002FB3B10
MTQAKPLDRQNPTWQQVLLLAVDLKNSVLAELDASNPIRIAYSPYGQQSSDRDVMTRLGFNGELREAKPEWYLLGNGYRAYNPRLMRFHSPDSLSPFGAGGVNSYAYCSNDPINSKDPTGHMRVKGIPIRAALPKRSRTPATPATPAIPQGPSVIVESPKSAPKNTHPATKNRSEAPIARNPVAEPIASLEPSLTPSITTSQPSSNTAHLQASEFEEMPKLMTMIDPYHRPLPGGKRTMPMLPIRATDEEIKKMRWLNPVVSVVRSS